MRIIVISGLVLTVLLIALIRYQRVDIIEEMSTEEKIAANYYTKAQLDEKIDKLERTIRIIAKNADKYIQTMAKDLYK